MKQIVRQLDILRELQARRYGMSARELADEYKSEVKAERVRWFVSDFRKALIESLPAQEE